MRRFSLISKYKKVTPFFVIVIFALVILSSIIFHSLAPVIVLFIVAFVAILLKRLFLTHLRVNEGDVIIFYGLPGSGKTLFLTKTAEDNKDCMIGVNGEFRSYVNKDFEYAKADLPVYSFGERYILMFDEASLDGFDNRNFTQNFKDEGMLAFFKKIRHSHGAIIMANQGKEEIDVKIRDSLCSRLYHCEKHHFLWITYCTATVLLKEEGISEVTGQPITYYSFPSVWDRILDPTLRMYAFPKKYAKLYNTYDAEHRPLYPYLVRGENDE